MFPIVSDIWIFGSQLKVLFERLRRSDSVGGGVSLGPFQVCPLCFWFMVQDVSPQLPTQAALPSLHCERLKPWNISPNQLSCKFPGSFYHNNRSNYIFLWPGLPEDTTEHAFSLVLDPGMEQRSSGYTCPWELSCSWGRHRWFTKLSQTVPPGSELHAIVSRSLQLRASFG